LGMSLPWTGCAGSRARPPRSISARFRACSFARSRNSRFTVATAVRRLGQQRGLRPPRVITGAAPKRRATIVQLARESHPRHVGRRRRIVRHPVLSASQEYVAVDRPSHAGEEPAVFRQEAHARAPLGQMPHERRAHGNLTEANDPVQGVTRKLQFRLAVHAHKKRLSFLGKVRPLGCDEQRVKMLHHPPRRPACASHSEPRSRTVPSAPADTVP